MREVGEWDGHERGCASAGVLARWLLAVTSSTASQHHTLKTDRCSCTDLPAAVGSRGQSREDGGLEGAQQSERDQQRHVQKPSHVT